MKSIMLFLAAVASTAAVADIDTVLILHTNDLHDHIRPDYDGVGGMPYISGYVKEVRSKRNDVLLLDAGDVMEKGDLLAFKTRSAIMYEAMQRIGYQAGAIGNHDIDYGVPQFHESRSKAPGMALLCVNLFKEDGSLEVPASKVFEVDGVRVGVIGSIVPREENSLSLDDTAKAIARESEALQDSVDLTVVVSHQSSRDCARMSETAPLVDVFVSGHSHELLREPIKVAGTGAVIVQAGSYARHVGRLEVTIDMQSRKVLSSVGETVEMRHDTTPCDREMLEWVLAREQEICPEARIAVGHTRTELGANELARLAADAMRERSGADFAFCHPTRVMRNKLPQGEIDVNALYRTGGTYGARIYRFTLSGSQILQYFEALELEHGMGQTYASGNGIASRPDFNAFETALEPGRMYNVVMTYKEFETRFLRAMERHFGLKSEAVPYTVCEFNYTDALREKAAQLAGSGIDIADYAGAAKEPQ